MYSVATVGVDKAHQSRNAGNREIRLMFMANSRLLSTFPQNKYYVYKNTAK